MQDAEYRKQIFRDMSAASEYLASSLGDVQQDVGYASLEQKLVDRFDTYTATYSESLRLFKWPDIDCARWLSIEMFAAYAQAVEASRSTLFDKATIVLPRLGRLKDWFEGGAPPPWVLDERALDADTLRHDVVPPRSEFPTGMPVADVLVLEPPGVL